MQATQEIAELIELKALRGTLSSKTPPRFCGFKPRKHACNLGLKCFYYNSKDRDQRPWGSCLESKRHQRLLEKSLTCWDLHTPRSPTSCHVPPPARWQRGYVHRVRTHWATDYALTTGA